MAGNIVVRGNNIMQPPLLISEEAQIIEFRDGDNNLNALMVKVFGDENDLWGLVTRADPDWQETLIRYGYQDITRPIEDVIRKGV